MNNNPTFDSHSRQGALVQEFTHNGLVLAVVLRAAYSSSGIDFFTPSSFSQQLGYMNRPLGHVIPPHVHNPVPREVHYTKEVLFIRKGRVRVDLYTEEKKYVESTIVQTGDVVLLAYGGHGFEMLETSEIVEVKQGPYAGEDDKTRFEPVGPSQIRIVGPR